MANALAAGYASASTDTGHTGPAANTFANEDVLVDFAHRAIHETTVAAKRVVDAFYGAAPKFAYFNGCSTGGRQALTAAQRYPEDFNGIVAGAPATFTTKQAFGQIWFYQAIAVGPGAIPKEKLATIHAGAMAACDANDGATDGIIENPLACTFDPGVLACKGGDEVSCLTAPQVEAVRRVYAGASNPRTGEKIFPGLERGSELGWSPVPVGYAVDYFKHIVFKDPELGSEDAQLRQPPGRGLPAGAPDLRRQRSEARRVRGPRRPADHVSGLGRAGDPPGQHRDLPGQGAGPDRRGQGRRAAVHGAGHGPLRRRERHEHLRHAGRARRVGGRGPGAGANPRFPGA